MKSFSIFLLYIFLFTSSLFAQNTEISGRVIDQNGRSIDFAEAYTTDNLYYVQTDAGGFFSINLPKNVTTLVFRHQNCETLFWQFKHSDKLSDVVIVLKTKENLLEEITISDSKLNSTGTMRIDPRITMVMPTVSGGIESLLMSQLGVKSNNELSSQYSVRGGNFDENSVYVNGIEIYRPQLIRSGQQEGLSFVNPLMVSSVQFSAGGFDTQYGDKMSSVLDVKYKKPSDFGLTASAGLLGAELFSQGTLFDKKLKFINGFRYKTNRYMLNTLETEGAYRPAFIDYQAYLSYSLTHKVEIGLLLNLADNKYDFIPESSHTSFGTISESYGLDIYFDGRESDRFSSATAAIFAEYKPDKNLNLNFTLSGFKTRETETFDILGAYYINQLNRDIGSEGAGDSLLNLGIGAFLNHARNKLDIERKSFIHHGTKYFDQSILRWGTEFKQDIISDRVDEWQMLDSSGYSIPYMSEYLNVYKNIKAKNSLTNNIFTAYIQDTYNFETLRSKYELTGGIRLNYNTYNEEFLISPRISAAYMPESAYRHIFRISGGMYYQPPFYKEIRDENGTMLDKQKAQKSIHFVAGNEFMFKSFGRTFKMYTELYYKILDNVIPYMVDNVRIRYYADQRAKGYAAGLDMKIGGEFVPDVDSWFSLSLMKTEENIYNNGSGTDDGTGYYPRPTDQRATAGIFFQDYIPGRKNLRAHLNLLYGTALPFGPPERGPQYADLRMPDYKRVDLGFSAVLIDSEKGIFALPAKKIKSAWITVEVFNLLDVENTVSYTWVRVIPNASMAFNGVFEQYAVPNHLTGRRLNVKLSVSL